MLRRLLVALGVLAMGMAIVPFASASDDPCIINEGDPECTEVGGPVQVGPLGGNRVDQSTPPIMQSVPAPWSSGQSTVVCHPNSATCYGVKYGSNQMAYVEKDAARVIIQAPVVSGGFDPNKPSTWPSAISVTVPGGTLFSINPGTTPQVAITPRVCSVTGSDPDDTSC